MQTKKVRIALVGAGQIGSRHLQAIGRIQKWPVEVYVVEPNPVATGLAKERLREVVPHESGTVRVEFFQAIEQISGHFDIAIVATSAAVRRTCIEKLLTHTIVRYLILEKVLFQREEDYPAIAQLLAAKGTPAWVNCPRRVWPVYQAIRQELANDCPIDLQVTGTNWGLGCNAIHLLDLFTFLAGESEIELNLQKLDPDPIAAKRDGCLEFTGLLTGHNQQGSTISLLSSRIGTLPSIVAIGAGEIRCLIMEDVFRLSLKRSSSSKWELLECKAPRQSELTDQVVETLLETGSCLLTPYEDSARLHLNFIRCLNGFLERLQGEKVTVCPIT